MLFTHLVLCFTQTNVNDSHIFGTTEICFRHMYFGLLIAPGKEANGDNLRTAFRFF